jgi:hypothetical protein
MPKTNTIQQVIIGRDGNGNKIAHIKTCDGSFSIQTLGNLPKTHSEGVWTWTANEINAHVKHCGTSRQKRLCDIGNSLND